MTVELQPDELRSLTKRIHTDAQESVLKKMGIPYRPHPDGGWLVARKAVEAWLLGQREEETQATVPQVDVAAIRGFHGKTARAHGR